MKPVVPVHVFTGPVFSYNKTNVICHIHYFNPRNKVYIKIYIYFKVEERSVLFLPCKLSMAQQRAASCERSVLSLQRKMSQYTYVSLCLIQVTSFFSQRPVFWGGGSRCIAISAFYTILRWCHLSDFVLAVNKMGLTFTFHSCLNVESYIRGWFKASIKYMAVNANNF